MIRLQPRILLGAACVMAASFIAGSMWSTRSSADSRVEAARAAPGDAAVATAEAEVAGAQRDFDMAMDDLGSPARPSRRVIDPEIQRGQRQTVELMELSCNESGYNCEYARVMRRQYEETYGQ